MRRRAACVISIVMALGLEAGLSALAFAQRLPFRERLVAVEHETADVLAPLWSAVHGQAQPFSFQAPFTSSLSLPEDAHWESWTAPSLSGFPTEMVEYQGKLVLTGGVVAGTACCSNIWTWDGSDFEPLPSCGSVRALAVWQGQLVAATATTGPTSEIIVLVGSQWDTLGVANDQVEHLAEWNGQLVVGGRFTSISGLSFENIARFDGSTWSGFGAGFPIASDNVQDLTVHAGELVATVDLSVKSWSEPGGVWTSLGPDFNSIPITVSDGGTLFAVGPFTLSGAVTVRNFARWDGAAWQEIESGVGTPAAVWSGGLALRKSLGTSRVANYDGNQIVSLPDSISFGVSGPGASRLLSWGTKLVISGGFVMNGSVPVPGILIWDGNEFTTVGVPWEPAMRSPTLGSISDLSVWNGDLVASGTLALTADQDHYVLTRRVAVWDGAHWSRLGDGLSSRFYTVLGTWNGQLVAGGFLLGPVTGPTSGVARWDGSSWLGMGDDTLIPDAFAEFGGELCMADESQGAGTAGVARWTGATWQPVGGGLSSTGFPGSGYALIAAGDSLIAGGRFDHAGGGPASNIASWDGTAWRSMGAGFDEPVFALATWNGGVVAGGMFTSSGPQVLSGVAFWDGVAWSPLGTNAVTIRDLRTANDVLFASGTFHLPDLSQVSTVARWTGTEWHLLGSGQISGPIEIYDGYLYCAGAGLVNGQPSHGLSRLPLDVALAVPGERHSPNSVTLSASPNPARGGPALEFTLGESAKVRLTVHDVTGRLVATLLDGPAEAGAHRVRWSGPAPPGVYFARLSGLGGEARVTRVVRLE